MKNKLALLVVAWMHASSIFGVQPHTNKAGDLAYHETLIVKEEGN